MKKLLFIVFVFFSLFSAAQNINSDSLWNIWENKSYHDTIRLNAITEIAGIYSDNNPDTTIQLINLKYNFALQVKNEIAQSNALITIGRSYYSIGKLSRAIAFLNKGLTLAKKINDKNLIADVYNDFGNVYIEKGEFQNSLEFYLKALKINEENSDKESTAIVYMNIGNIYYSQKLFNEALQYYNKALKSNQEINRKSGTADCYINLSAVCSVKNKHEDAIEYLTKATKLQEEIDDKIGLLISYNNLGDNYIKLNNFEKALELLFKSEKIGLKNGFKPQLAVCYLNIADIYLKQNKLNDCNNYLIKAEIIVNEIGYKELQKELYHMFSNLFEKKGDYKKAFDYNLKYTTLKDNMLSEESSKIIAELNTKYQTEKKEQNITILTKDKDILLKDYALSEARIKNQKIFNYIVVGSLILALLLAFFIYYRYSAKQKLNTILRTKNTELIDKNGLIELQKEKIIDNITYAKRIQQSILVDEKVIQSYLPNLFIFYVPKDIVSGDFYWCSKINDDIILAAIDCTGHGVSGAFMSMIGNTLLNQIVNEKHITTPSEILRLLNISVFEAMNQGKEDGVVARDGMDMALCTINYTTKQLQFAGAKNALYLINNNQLEIIKGDNHSIGGSESNVDPYKETYTNHAISIAENMSIYLFTDGYVDQFGGPNRKKLGMIQFREMILKNQHLSMFDQKIFFEDYFKNWKKQEQQIDDILLIGVKL